jgi:5-methyltetrahydrofolate--homocysteine methyltransferase
LIGISALLTTTMEAQRKMVQLMDHTGQRLNYKFIVGGAPVTHSWSDAISADGYADDAISAVGLVDSLIG